VAFLIVYAVGFSLVAVDLVMSIEPRWTSTLFPAYVFTGNVYAGAAAVGALAAWTENGAAGPQGRSRIHDFANVMVAFALFWTYLFWSQFLVLWYGNVTAEIGFMTARIGTSRPLGWIVLVMCSAVPAIICVPQRGKTAAAVKLVAPIVLAGLWLEKWVLVVPDAPTRPSIVMTVLTTAIFAAAFWLSVHPVRAPSLEARQRGTSSYA
jgi:hypothetical protein